MAENILLDSSKLPESPIEWLSSRAFQYGDGVFESMLCINQQIRFAHEHAIRLTEGLALLQIEHPFKEEPAYYLTKVIPKLLQQKGMGKARLKLMVWRTGSGRYIPESKDSAFALIAEPYVEIHSPIERLGMVNHQFAHSLYYQQVKTLSSLKYVVAGLEQLESPYDSLLFNTKDGYLTESIQSNLFIVRDGEILSPDPALGMVHGVVLRKLQHKSLLPFRLVKITEQELNAHDVLFLGNASGLRQIISFNSRKFNGDTLILQELKAFLGFTESKPPQVL